MFLGRLSERCVNAGNRAAHVPRFVPGASWTSSGSGEELAHIVTRALKPIRDGPNTDFGVVPDPRIFSVEVAGKVESVPVHLIFRRVADLALTDMSITSTRCAICVSSNECGEVGFHVTLVAGGCARLHLRLKLSTLRSCGSEAGAELHRS